MSEIMGLKWWRVKDGKMLGIKDGLVTNRDSGGRELGFEALLSMSSHGSRCSGRISVPRGD
ncbi:hypothetical protein LINPERHAP1_LOCUS8165 [Linum perenne]